MNKTNLPFTPMLQQHDNQRVTAKQFYKEYSELCEKYNSEISINCHNVECVHSNGLYFPTHTF